MIRHKHYYLILSMVTLLALLAGNACAQEIPVDKGQPAPQKQEAPAPPAPVISIKPLGTKEQLYSVELRDADIRDLFRVFAQDYKLNLLIDKDVQGTVTASFNNVSIEDMLDAVAKSNNLILEKEKNIIKIKPNLIIRIFTLINIEAIKLIQQQGVTQAQGAGAPLPGAAAAPSTSTIFDLLSDKGKILLGDQPNSIMVIDYPTNIENIGEYLKLADQKMTAKVFNLKYISVTDIFPEVTTQDREERKKQRDERKEEYEEIKSIQPASASGN